MKYRTSELMICETLATGRLTYYVAICGTFRRISKAEYDKRYQSADGLDCIYTVAKRHYRRQYCTVRYEVKDVQAAEQN